MNNLSSLLEKPTANGAFFTQYLSVMIIILCMIVGLFSTSRRESTKSPKNNEVLREPIKFGGARISNMFTPNESNLNKGNSWALTQVLKSHDIGADIDVFGGEDIELGIRRANELTTYLVSEGIPASAIRIFALEGGKEGEILVNFEEVP